MHSWSIMVESMSAISIFFRRPAAGCTTMSTGASARRSLNASVADALSLPSGRAMSQATPSVEPVDPACADRRLRTRGKLRRHGASGRMGDERGDERHGWIRWTDGQAGAHPERDPDSRADSERQVGTRAGDRPPRRGRGRQCRCDAGLRRARRVDRQARPGRAGRRPAPPLRPRGPRRALFGRALARRRRDACRCRHVGPASPDLRRRHRALLPGADGRAVRHARGPGRHTRRLARQAGGGGRSSPPSHPGRARRLAAGRLRPTDSQRIVRALEVLDASGRSILDWQARKGTPLVEARQRHAAGPGAAIARCSAARIDAASTRMIGRRRARRGRRADGARARSEAACHEGDRRARASISDCE